MITYFLQLTVLGTLSYAGLAYADLPLGESPYKVFPGTLCRQVGTNSLLDYDSRGRVFNPTDRKLSVICPIVRDTVLKQFGSVQVVVADRSENDDISCEAFSAQTDGLGWSTSGKSIGYNPEWYQSQTISLRAPREERDFGSFYLVCTLPAKYLNKTSGILTYRLDYPVID